MPNRRNLGGELLRTAHLHPGLTRADAARELGTGTGATPETVARLLAGHLLAEGEAASAGRRGRPTGRWSPTRTVRPGRDREDDAAAVRAVAGIAAALGYGVAGLVNALDADLVTLGGVAARVLDAAPDAARSSLDSGLMAVRRHEPPVLTGAASGADGPLVGAAELVWSGLWDRLERTRGAP